MARLFPEDQTHVNTRVAGTNGYMAPEYIMHGHLSVKADVFSFGVVILELISGQRNSTFSQHHDAQNLLDWAYKCHKKDRSLDIMDPVLTSSASIDQVQICIRIGLLCTQGDPQLRPSMHRLVVWLSKKAGTVHLDEPTRPGVPGSRYRRSHRPPGMSSTGGSSRNSDSRSLDSSVTSITATTSTSVSVSPRRLDRGKRPMES
uniref:Kinase family protein n=3 Tax=Rhizophora mucronata TaxID=61149 RepID=A0A2P2KKW5_RHIMU